MAEIIGVIFKEGGKVYYFAPGKGEYAKGSGVVVETARGVEYATVVIPRSEVEESKIVSPLKPVIRAATAKDTETHRKNIERKDEAMRIVREKIAAFGLDMKLIDCEFAFEGNKAVFYYTAPKRVDFRELVKELSSAFSMRIELRQVGLRDGIQMLGGLAPCGRECCCATCMPDIKKVSIKMAKNQGLSLNPSKISGLCGRLMCCLAYENDYYAEACKQMPKMGSEVNTPDGKGFVVNLNMLKMQVRVKIEDKTKDIVTYKDFSLEDIGYGRATESEEREDADAEKSEDAESAKERKIEGDRQPKPKNRNFNKGKKESGGDKNPDKNRDKSADKNDRGERTGNRQKPANRDKRESGDGGAHGEEGAKTPNKYRKKKFRKKPDKPAVNQPE